MPALQYHTAEWVRALPEDGNRYETVYGELLVTPAPRVTHQEIVKRLVVELELYLRRQPAGVVLAAPADISWGPDSLVQPDVFVASSAEVRTGTWSRIRTLLLAIEVLSPSTARADRFAKRRLYQEAGVPLYWIVDPEACTVEAWRPEAHFPELLADELRWHPEGATEPFRLEFAKLFIPV